jgi:hypothetical protein
MQKTQPLCCSEGVLTAPLCISGSYPIVACVFLAAGMCLPSRCLAMNVCSDFAVFQLSDVMSQYINSSHGRFLLRPFQFFYSLLSTNSVLRRQSAWQRHCVNHKRINRTWSRGVALLWIRVTINFCRRLEITSRKYGVSLSLISTPVNELGRYGRDFWKSLYVEAYRLCFEVSGLLKDRIAGAETNPSTILVLDGSKSFGPWPWACVHAVLSARMSHSAAVFFPSPTFCNRACDHKNTRILWSVFNDKFKNMLL